MVTEKRKKKKERKRKRKKKEEKEKDEDCPPRLNRFSNIIPRFPCYYNTNSNDDNVKKI
jgi:hypothetical protein